jgi:hypothetical protein
MICDIEVVSGMKKPSSIPKALGSDTSRIESPGFQISELKDRQIPERMVRCVICGSDTQAASPEKMCWVCRRLKISAWRDMEPQLPAQE